MKSYVAKSKDIQRQWYVVDAEGQTLGRLITQVATILMGKHKPEYTANVDTGDYVIVVNAEKIHLTGKKWEQKEYRYNTGYPGGLRKIRYSKLVETRPEKIIELAVKGMLPKTTLGRQMAKKLKVVKGPEHKFAAQKPVTLELK